MRIMRETPGYAMSPTPRCLHRERKLICASEGSSAEPMVGRSSGSHRIADLGSFEFVQGRANIVEPLSALTELIIQELIHILPPAIPILDDAVQCLDIFSLLRPNRPSCTYGKLHLIVGSSAICQALYRGVDTILGAPRIRRTSGSRRGSTTSPDSFWGWSLVSHLCRAQDDPRLSPEIPGDNPLFVFLWGFVAGIYGLGHRGGPWRLLSFHRQEEDQLLRRRSVPLPQPPQHEQRQQASQEQRQW